MDGSLLYARVDAIDDYGTLKLMELELAEPYLFFELDPEAANHFINAMNEVCFQTQTTFQPNQS